MMTLYDANIGTVPIRKAHQFNQPAPERCMAENVEKFLEPISVDRFKGGQLNPTCKVTTSTRTTKIKTITHSWAGGLPANGNAFVIPTIG